MNLILIFTLTALAASCEAKTLLCETSRDCGDITGRSLCVAGYSCIKDIGCNKDDCSFFGIEDIKHGLPAPKCVVQSAARKRKYGIGICTTSTFGNEVNEAS